MHHGDQYLPGQASHITFCCTELQHTKGGKERIRIESVVPSLVDKDVLPFRTASDLTTAVVKFVIAAVKAVQPNISFADLSKQLCAEYKMLNQQ